MDPIATNFLSRTDPDTHRKLIAGFVAIILGALQIDEGATHDDLSSAAAGLLEALAIILGCMDDSHTPAGRKRLVTGVATEINHVIEGMLADPIRSRAMCNVMKAVMQ